MPERTDTQRPPRFDDDGSELSPSAPRRMPRRVSLRLEDLAPAHPDSLAHPRRLEVLHSEIEGDPFNLRDRLPSVQRLAWTIYLHGLLENLVVIEHPSERARQHGKKWQLRAGSRRYAAIGMLIEGVDPPAEHPDKELGIKWTWPPDRPIPVLVAGSSGEYARLIENVERADPQAWELGRRISEILSAGVSARDLGAQLGRSNGWILRYAHIGDGLAPELVAILEQEKHTLRLSELAQLAELRDQFGDPDGPAQLSRYRERGNRRRRTPRRIDPSSLRSIIKRIHYLRSDMPVPSLLRPLVDALITYLDNGGTIGFRQLQEDVIRRVQALSPEQEGA